MSVHEWLPDQLVHIGRVDWSEPRSDRASLRLQAGQSVVLDRQPWRVLEIKEYPYSQWPESYQQSWHEHLRLWRRSEDLNGGYRAAEPPDWAGFYKRPVVLVLGKEHLPKSAPKHWCAPASHDWQILPDHYAACRVCDELPPCRNGENRWNGGPRRNAKGEPTPLMVPLGCCIGCAELIKPRTRSITFPGPNLWYPGLGEGSASFHARTSCADHVSRYRRELGQVYAKDPRFIPDPLFSETGAEILALPRTRSAADPGRPLKIAPRVGSYPASTNVPATPLHGDGLRPAPEPDHHRPAHAGTAHLPPELDGGHLARITQFPGATGHALGDLTEARTADQTARAIEELTAAVRNIAARLNLDPPQGFGAAR
ncbi:hypothetical protein ACIA8O_21420 [Kitasatospora sp. NPDC051853]|uniref:hypothetical protein n=1 Tax=Kitasatospora sp. NPDC051853 TaxID=3364058 RepID=UPI0037B7E258